MKFILVLGLALQTLNAAHAFTLNSSTDPNLKGWDGADVKLMVNTANCPAGVDVVGLVSDAVAVWNNIAGSSIKASYGGSTTSTTFSSPPTVYCETNFQAVVGADPNGVPGAASVNAAGGQIVSGVIYLNASGGQANIGNFNSQLLKIILAHEIGHLLGLGHSDSTHALMYYDASAKKTLNLSQDDIDGMSYLYPSNELSDNKFAGCGLVKNLPPPNFKNLGLLLLLLVLPFALLLKLRSGKSQSA